MFVDGNANSFELKCDEWNSREEKKAKWNKMINK